MSIVVGGGGGGEGWWWWSSIKNSYFSLLQSWKNNIHVWKNMLDNFFVICFWPSKSETSRIFYLLSLITVLTCIIEKLIWDVIWCCGVPDFHCRGKRLTSMCGNAQVKKNLKVERFMRVEAQQTAKTKQGNVFICPYFFSSSCGTFPPSVAWFLYFWRGLFEEISIRDKSVFKRSLGSTSLDNKRQKSPVKERCLKAL